MGVDRLLASSLFADTLAASVRVVFRIGGSLISTRTLDWMSKLPLATIVRVRDDGFESSRHDSTWIADQYLHAPLSCFILKLTASMQESTTKNTSTGSRTNECSALKILRLSNALHAKCLQSLQCGSFSEPQIALILQQEGDGNSPVYLSSSMACRDYDGFAAGLASTSCSTHDQNIRRIACNRGANGIDGVISSTAGFAYACSTASTPVTLLIGDVATLHDITGISVAADSSPGSVGLPSLLGGGKVGKIVCVNNSGGAIFSFLPAAAHRNDYFSPFLDTPHTLDLSAVATALLGPSSSLRSVRVSSSSELITALNEKDVFFIECVGLPSHENNVLLHKKMTQQLTDAVDNGLIECVHDQLKWTLHIPGSINFKEGSINFKEGSINFKEGSMTAETSLMSVDSKIDEVIGEQGQGEGPGQGQPLVVLLHGWMGCEEDWSPVLREIRQSSHTEAGVNGTATASTATASTATASTATASTAAASTANALPSTLSECNILTVSSIKNILSPSLFCSALKRIIEKDLNHTGKIFLVGYSQGGRLAMHYRSMFPSTVQGLITLSTCPGKVLSNVLEGSVLSLWRKEIETEKKKKDKGKNMDIMRNVNNSENKNGDENVGKTEVPYNNCPSRNFLLQWYALPVFSNISLRHPIQFDALIERKLTSDVPIDCCLRNMICTSMTNDSYVDDMLVGELDTKYHKMGLNCIENKTVGGLKVMTGCGHVLLSEASPGLVSASIRQLHPVNLHTINKKSAIKVTITLVRILPFALSMRDPLTVLSLGQETVFHSRRGLRVLLDIKIVSKSVGEGENVVQGKGKGAGKGEGKGEGVGVGNGKNEGEGEGKGRGDNEIPEGIKEVALGVGEIYEPVFTVLDRRQYVPPGNVVTYESMKTEISDVVNKLQGRVIEVAPSPVGVAAAYRALAEHVGPISTPVAFGLQQCILHALSQITGVCLVDCIGMLMAKGTQTMKRSSHVSINGFASMRDKKKDPPAPLSTSTSNSTSTSTSTSTPPHAIVSSSRTNRQRRPILKLKVGNADGTGCLSDAQRVNELVAQSLSESESTAGEGIGTGAKTGTGTGTGAGTGTGTGTGAGTGTGVGTGTGTETGTGTGTGVRWLRLDANQSWSIDQAITFGNALTPDAVRAIEYVEEPLRIDPHNSGLTRTLYGQLRHDCSAWRQLTIAMDETLVQREEGDVRDLLNFISSTSSSSSSFSSTQLNDKKGGIEWCVVVKPALVSLDCFCLMREQEQDQEQGQGRDTVTISCTFESGFTLAYLVCIASFFTGSHGVHAKVDMAAGSPSTQEYISILQDDGNGGKSVQVSKALELINKYSKIDSSIHI